MKKARKREPARQIEKAKVMRTHESNAHGVTMEEAESVNRACTKWLRDRNLLYDTEAIKAFMFAHFPE